MTAISVYNNKGDGYGAGTDGGGLNGYCSINKQGSSNLNFKVGGDYKVLKCKAQDGTDYELNGLSSINLESGTVYEPWTQPVLTENGTLGGDSFAVVGSSVNSDTPWQSSGYQYWNAFDVNTNSTCWHSANSQPQWITFYNPNSLNVTNLQITNWCYTGGNTGMSSGIVEGSSDNLTWVQLTEFTNSVTTPSSVWNIDLSSNSNSYKYYRIKTTSSTYPNYTVIGNVSITATQAIPPVSAGDYNVMAKTDKSTYLDQTSFYRQPDKPVAYSELGNLSIDNDYLASNFSSRNAIIPDKKLVTGSNSWEIETVVKTGSDVSTAQDIIGEADNVNYKTPKVSLGTNYALSLSSNGSSWDIANAVYGSYSVPANSTEYIKYGWDGSKYYVKNKQDTESKSENTSALPSSAWWNSVTYGSGTYVTVATNTATASYSTDGTSWTASTLPANQAWTNVFYGNGKFITIADSSATASYSADGITWTSMTLPTSNIWVSGAYGSNKYVITAASTSTFAYSSDGTTWTSGTMPSSQDWMATTFGNSKFVSLANDSNIFAYSTDGVTWVQSTLPTSQEWVSVAYGNGKFVAVATGSTTGVYSEDGVNWTTMTLPSSSQWKAVYYGKDRFVAISYESNVIAWSKDGINWTASTLPVSLEYCSITYGNKFVITASSTQSVINLEYDFDWVEDITVTSSTPIYQSSNNWAIGNNLISSSSQYPFLGSIDLKNTKVTVNNELYWNYDYGTYIWQDTSKLPVTVKKHNLTYWEDFNDLPIGRISVGSSGLSSVETFPYSSKAVTKASSTKPAMLINSYKNGTEWYYKYSDGWIEIGGQIAVTTSDKTINLMGFTMKDTNYEIQALGQAGYIQCSSKTTTTFNIKGSSATTALWKVAGYLK